MKVKAILIVTIALTIPFAKVEFCQAQSLLKGVSVYTLSVDYSDDIRLHKNDLVSYMEIKEIFKRKIPDLRAVESFHIKDSNGKSDTFAVGISFIYDIFRNVSKLPEQVYYGSVRIEVFKWLFPFFETRVTIYSDCIYLMIENSSVYEIEHNVRNVVEELITSFAAGYYQVN